MTQSPSTHEEEPAEEKQRMSLKKKTILIVCTVFLISGVLHLGVELLAIMPSFYALEREAAMDNMGRVLESINRELQVTGTTATDWAYWDDLYHFAGGDNPDFLKTNLVESTLQNAEVNLMNVYDPLGKLLWGKAMDLHSGEILNFGEISAPELPLHHHHRGKLEMADEVSGFFRTSRAPMMLVTKHILANDRTGPAHGTFVLGRFIDEPAIQRMAEQVRSPVSISVIPEGESVVDWQPLSVQGVPHSRILLKEAEDELVASTILADIHGRPLLRVDVATARTISARGNAAILLDIVTIGGIGLLMMVLLLFLLHFTILRPLGMLTTHSVQLGESDDLLSRLDFNRKDEIGVLANAFDQMIVRLAEIRGKLVDQSFHSGIAEMASGVLHNIGNAVTPLQVQVVTLNDELEAAPVAEMKMAARELADSSTAPARKTDLGQFVELAGKELAEVVGRARNHGARIVQQVHYIQQILADQDRYGRAARVLEPVSMEAIVLDFQQTLPLQAAIAIEIDPSVGQVGPVLGSRVVVQQVVGNLLVNAVEAIEEYGGEGGRIRIYAAKEVVNGTLMAHFSFEDNGTGIKEDDLKHIFERTFSTKKRNSGLGLHWSANSVNGLQGFLYARNNEDGRGACLHLLLPLAGGQEEQRGI